MKRIALLTLFLTITPITLGISLFTLVDVNQAKQFKVLASAPVPSHLYAALPENNGEVLGAIYPEDARGTIINLYLEKYHSPMADLGEFICTISDKYGLDWRLLIAIAQQESNLGKKAPENSFNPFGWGVHSRGTLRFSSWEEGIETVAKGIKEKYLDQGYTTPEEIMAKYTPLSSGSWAFGVNQFIQELETGQVN